MICRVNRKLEMAERPGVEIDFHTQCRSLRLDCGELD
jgi:Zn-finger nucleic acid-binding protein